MPRSAIMITKSLRLNLKLVYQLTQRMMIWPSKCRPLNSASIGPKGRILPSSAIGSVCTRALSAPRSPWQRAYVERLIGSIRRECLDHIIIFGERSLRRALASYASYYHSWRTHLSLGKDAPQFRRMQPSAEGQVVEIREVGGLHHHYERRAA